jgi:hypothetical protein
LNLYAYVGGDPVNLIDPMGLFMPIDHPALAPEIRGWTATGEKIADNVISKTITVGECICMGKSPNLQMTDKPERFHP